MAGVRHLLPDKSLLLFQLPDSVLIGGDDGGKAGVKDTVQKLADLLFGLEKLGFQRLGLRLGLGDAGVPHLLEHLPGDLEQAGAGRHAAQQFLEFALDLLAPNRLPIAVQPAIPILERLDIDEAEGQRRRRDDRIEGAASLRETQRHAWRLPDGRRIYEDNGRWRFEDESFVPAELARTRVPPR